MKIKLTGEPKYEHIKLQDAWKELTNVAFAVWVRMQNLDYDMNCGLRSLAGEFDLSRQRFKKILLELERKGYVDIEHTPDRFKKKGVVLLRHAVIYGPNTFVKLSRIKEMEFKDYTAKFNHIEGPSYEC